MGAPVSVRARSGRACLAAALLLYASSGPSRALAQGTPTPEAEPGGPATASRNPKIGLAHVDLMDLHVERRAGKPPEAVEVLTRSELAERYRLAAASGATWHRWSFYWDLIDRGGEFSWSVTDGIVSRDHAHGLQTLGVLHGNPPGVLDPRSGPPGMGLPIFRGADGALTDDPAAAASINANNNWARFVAAVVDRYQPGGTFAQARGWDDGSGVSAWEIGNEPNVKHFWHGTVAEYVRFLEVAYLAAKWVDPDCIILHGGIGDDGNAHDWYQQFAEALRARAVESPLPGRYNYYFDRAAWHWYTSRDNLVVFPERARAIIAAQGLPAKPIWLTEVGMPIWSEYPGPCWDSVSRGRATLAEQASFVWQSMAEALSVGVEVIIYFQLYDDCGNGRTSYDALGLVRNHEANQCWEPAHAHGCWRLEPATAGVPRPSYEALKVAARELSGARPVEEATAPDGGYRRVTLAAPDGRRITLAWSLSLSPRSIPIPASATQATMHWLAPTGIRREKLLQAAQGWYRVSAPGLTNRNGPGGTPLMGGLPVMLVEQPGLPAAASAAPTVADSAPPGAVFVRELPEVSLPRFDLQVIAGDDLALGAYVVYYVVDDPPRRASEWTPVSAPQPWPGTPSAGIATVPFEGLPGHTYYFTAQAGDTAGNWSILPDYPHAATTISGPAGISDDGPRPTRPRRYQVGFTPL